MFQNCARMAVGCIGSHEIQNMQIRTIHCYEDKLFHQIWTCTQHIVDTKFTNTKTFKGLQVFFEN